MTTAPTRHADTLIFPASLDPHAVTVVNRLLDADLEAYLVGGCVRDLLLGLIPKDFDISTEARPRQIRRLFRNSRIIGRRFKLAHVHFGDKIIEVATFRRMPEGSAEPGEQDPDLLITRDNEFGNAEQDAVRRDFTINALLYDVRSAEVIDYVGGVQDLNDRVLRTIGDPEVRFAEDPVRMLRAVKFMSRLGLSPAPDLDAAMRSSADCILRSAPPRVLEEIFKLMSCGKAGAALERFVDTGLLRRLLPEIGAYWEEHRDSLRALGEALDLVDRGQRVVSNAFLLAVLWERPWRAALEDLPEDGSPTEAAARLHALLDPAALRMSIPRRDVAAIRHVFQAMLRMERGRRGRLQEFLTRPSTREAVQLMYLLSRAGCIDPNLHAQWSQLVEQAGPVQSSPRREPGTGTTGQGRRRGRRGGRRRGGQGQRRKRGSGKPEAASPPDAGAEAGSEAAGAGEGARRGRSSRRRGGRRKRKSAAAASPEGGAPEDEVGATRDADGDANGDAEKTPPASKPTRSRTPKRRGSRGVSRRRGRRESTGSGSTTEASPRRDAPSTGQHSGPLREHPEDVEDLFDW
ncbi:MAG: polynucleotide adenylyltransferase PcnB [Planctomycetota bacterium]|jgi:poly(A) polymerase